MTKNGNDKLAQETAQLVTKPRKVRPTLLSVDNMFAENWHWVDLMEVTWILGENERQYRSEQLFEAGNTSPIGSVRCIVQRGSNLESVSWDGAQLQAWVDYTRGCKSPAAVTEIRRVLVPAGFAMNILDTLGGPTESAHVRNDGDVNRAIAPADEPLTLFDNRLKLVRPSQQKVEGRLDLFPRTKWYWVNLVELLNIKQAANPFEVAMWEAGFEGSADIAACKLTCVLNVVTSQVQIGWEEYQAQEHYEMVEVTFAEFVDIWNRRAADQDDKVFPYASRIWVPAGFAAKVLKSATTGSGDDRWSPTSSIKLGVEKTKH